MQRPALVRHVAHLAADAQARTHADRAVGAAGLAVAAGGEGGAVGAGQALGEVFGVAAGAGGGGGVGRSAGEAGLIEYGVGVVDGVGVAVGTGEAVFGAVAGGVALASAVDQRVAYQAAAAGRRAAWIAREAGVNTSELASEVLGEDEARSTVQASLWDTLAAAGTLALYACGFFGVKSVASGALGAGNKVVGVAYKAT